ncbi:MULTISPECIES: HigA family addiction module antitoxin [Paraburkholderia]|uniref:Plasmid maintenance system antidote protein, XRE family n=1 Tax=Paraburkholderia tropica TaxID=92647 RepID=A0A1A5X1C0_9BURK|nr:MULTISPECIES: HigA family addiction module antitoxin [Paraburkholderia]MBB2977257.1 addiction module HigA family antidote [Paraburkholderia tropica]MBB2997879.1 addiction module HigA family antidote [Paraburkholderia tropica]MBB6316901.1 addiction module HigA family antidote [Paraburkholderia tropica]MDE1142077.1 HigA family addiction module antitoxin [Paraburkholderia tropica]OBR47346.1 transcriptional regulator [Paraburkholderia tropica]
MSRMHNPPHPGEVLREWIPPEITVTQAAHDLHINRVTLSNLLNGKAGMTANLALRLSAWLGTTPEHWLGLQTQWDLWQARRQPRPRIRPLARAAAQAVVAAR